MNNTQKYLAPVILKENENLIFLLKQLNIYSVGITDSIYNKETDTKKLPPHLYFVIDVNGFKKAGYYLNIKEGVLSFYNVLDKIKKLPNYITDYAFSKTDNKHVIVFSINQLDFNNFIIGKYHLLYNEDQIDKFFPKLINKKPNLSYEVLKKTQYAKKKFIDNLIYKFNIDSKTIKSVMENDDYDFPPTLKYEKIR